jgi:Arc/MetJ-type ribon-helix-helix transcriptional regulator
MNTRIDIRTTKKLREKMEKAVNSGQFKNISDLIRQALENILKEGEL